MTYFKSMLLYQYSMINSNHDIRYKSLHNSCQTCHYPEEEYEFNKASYIT